MKRITMLIAVLMLLAGCSGSQSVDEEPAATEPPTPAPVEPETSPSILPIEPTPSDPLTEAATESSEASTEMPEPDVTVTAVDYAYEDVPATISAGSVIGLTNDGNEPHELVAFRISDEETRSIEELLALPEGEEPPVEFKGVAVATTDGQSFYPEGPLTLDEPGRYAFVCFLPQGITDNTVEEAAEGAATGEEPSFPEGQPHFTLGMWEEVIVE